MRQPKDNANVKDCQLPFVSEAKQALADIWKGCDSNEVSIGTLYSQCNGARGDRHSRHLPSFGARCSGSEVSLC